MAKATKKKPARKRKTKAADGEITAKRARPTPIWNPTSVPS